MKKIIKALLLLLWMGVIFYMSSQPDVETIETSNFVAEIIFNIYDFILGSVSHLSKAEFMELFMQPIRKLAHFTEFMILGILFYINLIEYIKDRTYLYALLCSCLYAISDEIHQLFVLNRYCSIKDMFIDTAGAIVGISICHLIYRRWKKQD